MGMELIFRIHTMMWLFCEKCTNGTMFRLRCIIRFKNGMETLTVQLKNHRIDVVNEIINNKSENIKTNLY